jgi:hypothetical protein
LAKLVGFSSEKLAPGEAKDYFDRGICRGGAFAPSRLFSFIVLFVAHDLTTELAS